MMMSMRGAILRQHSSIRQAMCCRHQSTTTASSAAKKGGAGIGQRLSSFFVGAGLTALVTQFYIYEEVRSGNQMMLQKQLDFESRLSKLEK
ncbi:hypothetical protein ACA910_010801 [Epithemia clementina (nom. ined.)]